MERDRLEDMIIAEAEKTGFSQCEIFYKERDSFEVTLLERQISHYENSATGGIAFRGIYKGKTGYAYTEDISEGTIGFLLENAKENAELSNEYEEFFEGEKYEGFSGYNPGLEQASVDERIGLARRLEEAALNGAEKIAALDYCVLGMQRTYVAIRNTKGLKARYTKNFATGYVTAIAKAGDQTKTGSAFWKGIDWEEFDPEATGSLAARRANALLGAESVKSGRYGVIFQNRAMAALLGCFKGIFFGENAQKGFSLLKGRVGDRIAAECVTIRDDAIIDGGYASVPFDDEGTKARNKAVVEEGRLKTLLYSRRSGKIDGVPSTGNGFRGGISAPIKTGCTNFYIAKGEESLYAMEKKMGDGILITELMGLHAGANAVSGDFSLSAEGFLIESGEVIRPIEQITVAGNFYDMLKDVQAVGEDIYFAGGGIGAPSILIKSLSVAGK